MPPPPTPLGDLPREEHVCHMYNPEGVRMASYAEHPIIRQALELLACEIQQTDTLQSPDAVKDYLRLKLGDRPHEVFAVIFMD